MNEAKINTSLGSSLLVPLVTIVFASVVMEHSSLSAVMPYRYEQHRPDSVFQNLPTQHILFEQNHTEILVDFVSKIMNDNHDLEGEIVDMVNRKFEKLLLKI